MNGWIKKAMAAVLTGTIALSGAPATAWARNSDSGFTTAENDSSADTNQIFLVKDYDSANDTSNSSSSPRSSSPAETFTYTITPYHVWNAGQTYSGTGTGTATQITVDNMPMLQKVNPLPDGITGVSYDDTTTDRTLVVTQQVVKSQAEYVVSGSAETVTNDKKAPVNLPIYDTVGDYWYKVEETIGTNSRVTGVIYGTNSATNGSGTNEYENFNHTATYYIHVQVTQGTSSLIRNVTLHINAPDTSLDNAGYNNESYRNSLYGSNKVHAIENRYYAGQLKVTKVVNGSAGVKDQYFKVRVKFIKPRGTVVNSDITIIDAFYNTATSGSPNYEADNSKTIYGQYANTSAPAAGTLFKWNKAANDANEAIAVAEFYVKDGTTVSFYNIPFGINYTVEEYSTGDWGYTNSFSMTRGTGELTTSFNGNSPALYEDRAMGPGSYFYDDDSNTTTIPSEHIGAQGSISGPNADVVTITNSKELTIDIGVVTKNAPYIAMLAVAGVAVVIMINRKKTVIED